MAGRALRGMLRTADYKGGEALKSLSYGVCSYLQCGFFSNLYKEILIGGSPFFLYFYALSVYIIK